MTAAVMDGGYPSEYGVALFVVLGVAALLLITGVVAAWVRGRNGGGRRG